MRASDLCRLGWRRWGRGRSAGISFLLERRIFPTCREKIDQALEQSDKELAERLKNGEVGEAAATWQETRLKEGDTLHGVTGTGVLLLAGRGRVTYKSGAVVDVTTGTVVPSGTNLTANHRYLTAEDTTAAYTVTSEPRW